MERVNTVLGMVTLVVGLSASVLTLFGVPAARLRPGATAALRPPIGTPPEPSDLPGLPPPPERARLAVDRLASQEALAAVGVPTGTLLMAALLLLTASGAVRGSGEVLLAMTATVVLGVAGYGALYVRYRQTRRSDQRDGRYGQPAEVAVAALTTELAASEASTEFGRLAAAVPWMVIGTALSLIAGRLGAADMPVRALLFIVPYPVIVAAVWPWRKRRVLARLVASAAA